MVALIIIGESRKVKRNDLFLPQPHQAAYPVRGTDRPLLDRQLSENRHGAGSGVQHGTVPETDQAEQVERV